MGLALLKNNLISNYDAAYMASNIEIQKLNKPIGRQDHFISSSEILIVLNFTIKITK